MLLVNLLMVNHKWESVKIDTDGVGVMFCSSRTALKTTKTTTLMHNRLHT